MFVTVDEQVAGSEGAVVTHVDGQLVHLVLPRTWVEGAPVPTPVPNPVAYALAVPALPSGVRVAVAEFPEAPLRPSVTSLPEGDAGARAANETPATVYPPELY